MAILSLLLPACATLRGSYPVEVSGRAAVEIDVGRSRESVPAAYLRYFPGSITLHPGDAVRFQLQGSGEPHTVTLGTLVQSVTRTLDGSSARRDPHAFTGFPKPIDNRSSGARVSETAVRPCVLDRTAATDVVSDESDCPRGDLPPFDGSQKYFSSGLLDPSNDVFRMELADSIRPGRYAFMCLVHPDVMRGTLDVVARGDNRPRPRSVMQLADDEEEETAESLASGARAAFEATPARAVAGLPAPDGIAAYLATFGQETYRIERGESVRWTIFGTHTVTFGAPPDRARDGFVVEQGDGVEANRALLSPVDSPAVPTDAQIQAASARRRVLDVKARWDGTGRLHSGLLSTRNAGTLRYSVAFSRPGTYKYQCLVHSKMRGTVVVT